MEEVQELQSQERDGSENRAHFDEFQRWPDGEIAHGALLFDLSL
jgi:hypothetical protein